MTHRPSQNPRTAAFLSLLTLFLAASSANAKPSACFALFPTTPGTSTAVANLATAPTATTTPSANSARLPELNDASIEFLSRLKYLTLERRFLGPEVFQQVIDATQPFNPLGNRPSNTAVLPHQEAFATLLKEDLQWDSIRQAAQVLAGAASANQQRADTATVETATVLIPIKKKDFPFTVETIVKTSRGQALGLVTAFDAPNKNTQITAHELPSGNKVSDVSFDGMISPWFIDTKVLGDQLLLTTPESFSKKLLTFDLLKQGDDKLVSNPAPGTASIGFFWTVKPSTTASLKQAHYIEFNGAPAVATFLPKTCYFYNPLTGAELQKIVYTDKENSAIHFSGRLTNSSIFVSDSKGLSVVMDPSSQQAQPLADDFYILRPFTFKKKNYALGIDKAAKPSGENRVVLKSIGVETGKVSKSFEVDNLFMEYPHLLDTFEQDGKIYGAINTSGDFFIVDLIKGAIVKKLSKSLHKGAKASFWINVNRDESIAFEYKGKTYLVGLTWINEDDPSEIAIFDALTLEIVGPTLKLDADIFNLRLLPAQGDERMMIVNFHDGHSQLVSLVNVLDQRRKP